MPIPHPVAVIGTIVTIVVALAAKYVGSHYVNSHYTDNKDRYRLHKSVSAIVIILAAVVIVILWARLLQHTGTFLGLIGAGLAIALKEPLLSIAGRIAIFAGRMYSVGDRIQMEELKGDVIDIGFFYTIMMEIGGWIGGDQVSGRIVQFPNAKAFGTSVFNYTRDFAYIWDEVKLPITYDSNIKDTRDILLQVGGDYTREFLKGAEAQLAEMQEYFLVQKMELKPQVYIKVTDNWVELTMRYVVEPKQRRNASSFIYSEVFDHIHDRDDITIASTTMDIGVHHNSEPPAAENGGGNIRSGDTEVAA